MSRWLSVLLWLAGCAGMGAGDAEDPAFGEEVLEPVQRTVHAEVCNGVDDDRNGIVDDQVGGYRLALIPHTRLYAGFPPDVGIVPVQGEQVGIREGTLTRHDGLQPTWLDTRIEQERDLQHFRTEVAHSKEHGLIWERVWQDGRVLEEDIYEEGELVWSEHRTYRSHDYLDRVVHPLEDDDVKLAREWDDHTIPCVMDEWQRPGEEGERRLRYYLDARGHIWKAVTLSDDGEESDEQWEVEVEPGVDIRTWYSSSTVGRTLVRHVVWLQEDGEVTGWTDQRLALGTSDVQTLQVTFESDAQGRITEAVIRDSKRQRPDRYKAEYGPFGEHALALEIDAWVDDPLGGRWVAERIDYHWGPEGGVMFAEARSLGRDEGTLLYELEERFTCHPRL